MTTIRRRANVYKAYTRRRSIERTGPRWFPDAPESRPPDWIRATPRASRRGVRRARPASWTTVQPQFNPTFLFEIIRQERRRTYRVRHGTVFVFIPTQIVVTPPPYPPQFIRYRRTPGVRARRGVYQIGWLINAGPTPVDPRIIEPIFGFLVTDGRTSGMLVTDGHTYGLLVTSGKTRTVLIT